MINKRIVSLFVLVAIMVMGALPVYADAPAIAAGNVTAELRDTVVVPLILSGNTGICGATLTIDYDERLVLTGIEKGTALPDLTMTKPGNLSANPFNLVWDGTDADASNGTVALMTFLAPNEPGTFIINVSYEYGDIVDGLLQPIDFVTQNGSITVENNSGEGGNDDPEQNDNITVSIDSVTADHGGSIEVPIRILNNTGICGATISVSYDNRLTLTQISRGEALSTLAMTKPGNLSQNPAKIVWDGMDADNSNGIIAILTFSVPNGTGKYDITLSYDDGDIVDGNLTPVNPLLQNGYIGISSSYGESLTVVSVKVAGQSVTLIGQNNSGKILAAFYAQSGKLLDLKVYDVISNINVDSVNNASQVKVMWWEGLNSIKPVCPAQMITIN